MTPPAATTLSARSRGTTCRGSVLIIVMWIALGLVSVTLYFANSMSLELRAADNRSSGGEAEQAIAGAARYVKNILTNAETPGTLPDPQTYRFEDVPVGDSTYWVIGRGDIQTAPDQLVFGLVDEASKLNLNTATRSMLEALPGMTPELAAAIIDWRDADDTVTPGGAESSTYQRLNPPYTCKNAQFESIDELRLVYGMNMDILYGEDANLNGVLDPNENDGDVLPPSDNSDGKLNPGILEYVTVYSREPNTRSDGSPRINISGPQQQLAPLLQEKLGTQRANEILRQVGAGPFTSVLEFYIRSRMTPDEFSKVESDITVFNSQYVPGLINVNTASETVLACIPGIGADKASALVAYRQTNSDNLNSIAWVAEAMDPPSAILAGPYLTARGYQFTADIAAVGHHGRGYRRVKFVFDTSESTPRIIYRQDLTHLGWALGKQVREALLAAKESK